MLANWPWHSIPWQGRSSPNSFILRYPLSNRDLEEMMLERGLHVDHITIYWK